MTRTPFVSSVLRKLAARKGFEIDVRVYTSARKNGWPQTSSKPIHLLGNGKHVAFADSLTATKYLCKQPEI
jgi:hypothetical protein